jgi:oligoribonuclease NrnB/cAMP/cGMP phosphodiesterase (DHH superfamily)
MSKFYIYHHTDDDGYGSASVVILYLLQRHKIQSWNSEQVELIPYCYEPNDNFLPHRNYQENDEIYVVDLSVSSSTLLKFKDFLDTLKLNKSKLIWVDHHKSSLDVLEDTSNNVKSTLESYDFDYLVNMDYCGMYNCWNLLFENSPVPEIVRLIDDWDCWKHKLKDTKSFHYGFDSTTYYLPTNDMWKQYLTNRGYCLQFIRDRVVEGNAILNFIKQDNIHKYKNHFDCELFGFNCCCLNATRNSDIFIEFDKYDVVLAFMFDGSIYKYSIYSPKNSSAFCNIIAEYFGGGGHKGASGFTSKKLVVSKKSTLIYKCKEIFRKSKYNKILKKKGVG